MKKISVFTGALLGALTSLVVVALTYLGFRFAGLPFVPFDLFDWLARVLPGPVVTFGIDTLVMVITRLNLGPTSEVAKQVEQGTGIALFILLGAVFGMLITAIGRNRPDRIVWVGMVAGLLFGLLFFFIETALRFPPAGVFATAVWLAIVFVGWGAVLGRLIRETAPQPAADEAGLSRRQFLFLVGAGSFTVVVTALGVSLIGDDEQAGETTSLSDLEDMVGASNTSGPAASPPQEALEARFEPVPGTRPELTPNEDFYRIDINTVPPQVDAANWRLEVDGLVNQPLSLSIEELRARPAFSQVITLSCISNQVGGDLISTSLWTGVRLRDILEEAGLRAGSREVYIESEDGFYESVPLEEAMDERTLLVYEMNGEPLPVEHGFPLRIFIPDHYGMKQPKWISRMEVIDHEGAGYWVDRGWSDQAIPKTTSVVDTVAPDAAGPAAERVPVGGIAYAGARGISKVEVQVDDGPWQEAELRIPPLSPLTWVQWRYEWPFEEGRHTFRVRAYDGTGALQETDVSDPHPSGATGIHARTVNLRG